MFCAFRGLIEMNVAVVHNIPSPYRLHLFEKMYAWLSSRGIGFKVNFMSDMSKGHGERPLAWRNPKMSFPHRYWKDCGIGCHHLNLGLVLKVLWHRQDILFVGSAFDTFTGILVSLFGRAKVKIAWTEGNTKTLGKMKGLKGFVKRLVFSRYDYVAVPGLEGERYIAAHQAITRMKMPRPVLLPNLVDETRFKPRHMWPLGDINRIRSEVGCSDETKLCIVPARLEWYKGLLEMFALLTPEMLSGWKILIMGSGSLKEGVESSIAIQGLADHVTIKDLIPYAEMPLYYAAADLFLFPSLMDRNPLSVVEAVHSGLPVALSDQVGNIHEGVHEGINGWVLPVKDSARFGQTLKMVFSADIETLKRMGCKSYEAIAPFWRSDFAVDRFLQSIVDAYNNHGMH